MIQNFTKENYLADTWIFLHSSIILHFLLLLVGSDLIFVCVNKQKEGDLKAALLMLCSFKEQNCFRSSVEIQV